MKANTMSTLSRRLFEYSLLCALGCDAVILCLLTVAITITLPN
jgi:hypothetical protein